MALKASTRNPYDSSGIYFTETDLTYVSNNTGSFSAASIGLTEKGPAFQITNSSSFDDRSVKLGGINQEYPTSFYARQFLEQSTGFKEVRLLGLEGYKDLTGWAIGLNISGSEASVPGNSPLAYGEGGLHVILKERPIDLTGRPSIATVEVSEATYTDPLTGLSTSAATDYLFSLVITYEDSTTETIICSLRPESKDYILKKIWDKPFKLTSEKVKKFPTIKNKICPLWIDFIVPSKKTRPSISKPYGYYLPGSTITQNYLPLLTGNISFGTTFIYNTTTVSNVEILTSSSTVLGTRISVPGNITSWWTGSGLKAITLSGITGTGNIILSNGTFIVDNVTYNSTTTTTSFDLYNYDDSLAAGTPTTALTIITSSSTYTGTGGSASKYLIPTFENEVLDFQDVVFQTPITPWIVSDGDSNGDFTKLFRFWSISDGESANTEIKIEIKNINPAGNNGFGTFDVIVRAFDDREDLEINILEAYTGLTMQKSSDNYILKKIGNGEEFVLRSRFIFIEMNAEGNLEDDLLPYGSLGYPNLSGNIMSKINWTLDYDQTKPISKQTLGLASNKVNMFKDIAESQLKYINTTNTELDKGFHLNPNNNSQFVTDQGNVFQFASQNIYKDILGNTISASEKIKRNKFVVDFYGGFDGWNVYSERTFGVTNSKDYKALVRGLECLKDKEGLDADFTILVTPDFYIDNDSSAVEATLDMVNYRGDCMYIPDLKYDKESDPQIAADTIIYSNIRSNNVAVYFPWLQIEDTVDKINSWLPPSLLALGTIAYIAQNENIWQPPGGSIRTVTNNLVRTRRRMKLEDREILKSASINPITLFPGSGYEITEVRTTQEKFSALSFIHNRLLLCYAKKTLNQILRPLLLELNGDLVKERFIAVVDPIFNRIKKLNGVEEYKIEVLDRPELNDRTTLYGRITIIPLYALEKIEVNFTIKDSAVSFND